MSWNAALSRQDWVTRWVTSRALALFGPATIWMAVFADLGATLLVMANGLRLMRA